MSNEDLYYILLKSLVVEHLCKEQGVQEDYGLILNYVSSWSNTPYKDLRVFALGVSLGEMDLPIKGLARDIFLEVMLSGNSSEGLSDYLEEDMLLQCELIARRMVTKNYS